MFARFLMILGLLTASHALVACGTEEVDPLPDGAIDGGFPADLGPAPDVGFLPDSSGHSDGPPADPSEPYFDPAHLVEVEIEIGSEDWDALRREARGFPGILFGDMCLDAPFASPFNYYPAKVTVDGRVIEQVGVRKKGFLGSLSELRPSLKIKFDELVLGQTLDGMERMTFNNAQQDASLLRTCIAYRTFAAAGLPASRCNFAHVTVNGQDLGVYVHVEEVKKSFLRRHFDDDEGLLYEGTLSDFRQGWIGTFEKKTNEEVPDDKVELSRVAAALELPDESLIPALEEVVDVDAFIDFWATESLLGHWDGYAGNTNNFFVYLDPLSARFYFLPWGPDAVLSESPFLPPEVPKSVLATSLMARRLYALPDLRAQYVARLSALLGETWDEAEVGNYISETSNLIRPSVLDPVSFDAALAALRTVVNTRRAELEPELLAGGADWNVPLRGSPCWAEVGRVRAELVTTWGTHPTANPLATGTGTLAVSYNGNDFIGITVGGSAGEGVSPDDQGQAVFIVPALLADNSVVVLYVVTSLDRVMTGGRIPIDFAPTRSALLYAPMPGAELQLVAWVGNGDIEVLEGSTTPGAGIRLSIDAAILGQGQL